MKRLPRLKTGMFPVRLEWEESNRLALEHAAVDAGLSVASFARLALELLVARKSVSLDAVRREALKRSAATPKDGKKPGKK